MRFSPERETYGRLFLALALICATGTVAEGQDLSDWESLTRLQAGDTIHLSLKAGPVKKGPFQSWTQQEIIGATVTTRRDDVLKIERYRQSGWGRGKTAFVGALIGLGAGFAVGAAVAGCNNGSFGPCITRFGGGVIVGVAGTAVGAGIGALLPRRHTNELIYSAK
jgi:hypothetical protein